MCKKKKKNPGNYTFHTINFSNKNIQISNSLMLITHNYTYQVPNYYKWKKNSQGALYDKCVAEISHVQYFQKNFSNS